MAMAYGFHIIFLLQVICSGIAAVPLVSLGSLDQSGTAPALNFSGSPIQSSPPGTTAVTGIFPAVYYVSYTNPQIIFKVRPGHRMAYLPYPMTYAVVYGMNVAVEICALHKGDPKIPAGGVAVAPSSVGISLKSSAPGKVDITYSVAASILRGIWELVGFYGSYTVAIDIYFGALNPAHYIGVGNVYIALGNSNVTVDGVTPIDSSDTMISNA